MQALLILRVAFATALSPMLPDTPPPLPVPVAQLTQLRTMQDVIAASLLENGGRPPAELVLPELQNRRQTIEYMAVNYPANMRNVVPSNAPVAWVLVDRKGHVVEAYLVGGSEQPALDSLSLGALRTAWFRPALIGKDSVGLWVPYPSRVPSYSQITAALTDTDDRSSKPMATPFDHAPEVLNRGQVEAAVLRIVYEMDSRMREYNERLARAQSAGGTTTLWVYVDATGSVANAIVKKTSGNTDLDNHALQVARIMRFSPAKNKGESVDVWIEIPIKFRSR